MDALNRSLNSARARHMISKSKFGGVMELDVNKRFDALQPLDIFLAKVRQP